MRLRSILALLSILLFSQFCFAADYDKSNQSNSHHSSSNHEASLLGWLVVLNKNEIVASKFVLAHKNLHPTVKQYARYLVRQHSELLNDTLNVSRRTGLSPVKGKDAMNLKDAGENLLAELKSKEGNDLQKTYINAMVKGHEQALSALNAHIKKDQNKPSIQNLLTLTKKHVVVHLEKAKKVQQKLGD